uniref:WAP domain-containing protein n=1 Tax=Graphocephala atropunctata TaxID=36148 RepID=A0A1B6KNF5_9HEMI
MHIATFAGLLVIITCQFSNTNSCKPDNSKCLFGFECCSGLCSLFPTPTGPKFFCASPLQSTEPTTGAPTTTRAPTTPFPTEPSTESTTEYLTPPQTTPSTTEEVTTPQTIPSTTEEATTPQTTSPTTEEATTPQTTSSTTEYSTWMYSSTTNPFLTTSTSPPGPWDNCRIPASQCTKTSKCCLWTCQLYGFDEKLGEEIGVCPVPLVPWPPFDRDSFPWNLKPQNN